MNWRPASRTSFFAKLVFASVVLATYSQMAFAPELTGQPWQVVLTFALGALHTVLFSTCRSFTVNRPTWRLYAYFILQTAIVCTIIAISPVRGFFGIIALPLVGQAVFTLPPLGITLVSLACYATSVAIWLEPYGINGALRAAATYLPGYLFSLVFTIISRQAIAARSRAEQLSQDLAAANDLLRAQAAQATELATARERNRLAREIHDGVGHYLTTIKVQLDAATALLPIDPPRAAESVGKATRLATEALDDVRRSVSALASEGPRPPLSDSLRALATDSTPLPTVTIAGTPRPLSSATEHALYRAAQEGLTNVRKHSAATAASVTLDFRDAARIRLTVADNGRGAAATATSCGYGLRGLQERIALLGGRVTTGAAREGGFQLEVELPS
ncbi:MAG: sensor histidine kinase [Verrucomicrobiota bacterium]